MSIKCIPYPRHIYVGHVNLVKLIVLILKLNDVAGFCMTKFELYIFDFTFGTDIYKQDNFIISQLDFLDLIFLKNVAC